MKEIDLEYTDSGIFTTFFPVSKQGENAWNELAANTDDTGKVLTIHKDIVITKLRKAGYHIVKATPVSKKQIESVYEQFDQMFGAL